MPSKMPSKEQIKAYIQGDKKSEGYHVCETALKSQQSDENDHVLESILQQKLTIEDKDSSLLSKFAHGKLTSSQNKAIVNAILHSECLTSKAFGIMHSPWTVYSNAHEMTNLFDFWLNSCRKKPEEHNDALDSLIREALPIRTNEGFVYKAINQFKFSKFNFSNEPLHPDVLSLWASHPQNARIQKTLLPGVARHFNSMDINPFFDNSIKIKDQDTNFNLVTLWTQHHKDETFNELLWGRWHCSVSDGQSWDPKDWHAKTWKLNSSAYAFITTKKINYNGYNIDFVNLSNQQNEVGAASRQQLNKIITILTPRERYQLLRHICGLTDDAGSDSESEIEIEKDSTLPVIPLSDWRKIIKEKKLSPYLHWLAKALLAARTPTGVEYAKYTLAGLAVLGLLGAPATLLLLHFVAAMPIVSALLHPASLAAGGLAVLCGGVAVLLFSLYEPSVSSMGQINVSGCPISSTSDSYDLQETSTSFKHHLVVPHQKTHVSPKTNNNNKDIHQTEQDNVQNNSGQYKA